MKLKHANDKPRGYNQGARALATEATGQKIVEAFLARLMQQWYDEITLDRIAEDAEVTLQTIVRRFGGKEGLLNEAVKTMAAQINARRASTPGDVEQLVDNLIEDYEHTGDATIRLLALEPRHQALTSVIEFGRSEHRRWVSEVFANTLQALDTSTREQILDSLVIITDVYTWKLLRRDMHRSVEISKQTIKNLIRGALGINHQSSSQEKQ